jgi:hypothetical protein
MQASSVDLWWLLASIRKFMTCRLAEGRPNFVYYAEANG